MTYAYIRPYSRNFFETHDYDVLVVFAADLNDFRSAASAPRRPHPDAILVEFDPERQLARRLAE